MSNYIFKTSADTDQQKLVYEVYNSDDQFLFALIYSEISKRISLIFGPNVFEIDPGELRDIIDKGQKKLLTWAKDVEDV